MLRAGAVATFAAACTIATGRAAAAETADYPIRPVPFTAVTIDDAFWSPRLETNRRVTIPYDFAKCEETGRIDNFAKAGHLMPGEFRGIFFDDSDVYKVIEGASYSLAVHPDAKLDAYLDGVDREDRRRAGARRISLHRPHAQSRQSSGRLGQTPLGKRARKPRDLQPGPFVRSGRGPSPGDRQAHRCWTWRSRRPIWSIGRSAPTAAAKCPAIEEDRDRAGQALSRNRRAALSAAGPVLSRRARPGRSPRPLRRRISRSSAGDRAKRGGRACRAGDLYV